MIKAIKTILLVLLSVTVAVAQPRRPMERIHAAKMAYITDRLRLTSEQSANFVPVYKQYEKEIFDVRQSFFNKYKGSDPRDADDATYKQYIDDNLDYQQQVLDIKRKYNDRFLKVITAQQLADLHKAEREFKQILMKRLEHNKWRGHRGR